MSSLFPPILIAVAGISTSAGIPDFRSRDGIYNTYKHEALEGANMSAKDLFSPAAFIAAPEAFFDLVSASFLDAAVGGLKYFLVPSRCLLLSSLPFSHDNVDPPPLIYYSNISKIKSFFVEITPRTSILSKNEYFILLSRSITHFSVIRTCWLSH